MSNTNEALKNITRTKNEIVGLVSKTYNTCTVNV